MRYTSTRNNQLSLSSAEAIIQGISKEGGLFVPETIPTMSLQDIAALGKISYVERAVRIMSLYLTDFTEEEIRYCADAAYSKEHFQTENICEIAHLVDGTYILELWHGPTCAFKDMALQILPHLMVTAAKKTNLKEELVILVATSGDTGKAALEGFKDVSGTRIVVFYPADGVSNIQRLQMVTQQGENVSVCAVKGNFDHVQTAVKNIFTNSEKNQILKQKNSVFSSANSINWGRLLPQIVYYISSYSQLVEDEELTLGAPVNIVVPTGNFGNILAAYMAKCMGLPVNKLICASNANNILTDFLNTGVYDRNRPFLTTISPSMDILISSNLERLLYWISGCNSDTVDKWFSDLNNTGKYKVSEPVLGELKKLFWAGFADDDMALATINSVYDTYSYTADPHTAVALSVLAQYREQTGDNTKAIVASTASPYKFTESVLKGIGQPVFKETDEFAIMDLLVERSGYSLPESLSELKNLPVRFDCIVEREQIWDFVLQNLS